MSANDQNQQQVIRILIVDDHVVVRKGLSSLLSASKYGIGVVGEAGDGFEAVEQASRLQPDVILMDLMMPRMSGLVAISKIRRRDPEARILVLTSFNEMENVSHAMKSGAMGYLLKDSTPDELVRAIRTVADGRLSLSMEMASKAFASDQSTERNLFNSLTSRELDVLKGLAKGQSNQEIADNLVISVYTVRSHIRNLLSKLELSNRTQAALYAIDNGLVQPDS